MSPELIELGRRAVAAGFIPVAGTRTTDSLRVISTIHDTGIGLILLTGSYESSGEVTLWAYDDLGWLERTNIEGGPKIKRLANPPVFIPDFSDAATLGCLLALVPESMFVSVAEVASLYGWGSLLHIEAALESAP